MNAIVSSATAWRFTPGVHRTLTPQRRAAARSIMSSPTPYLLTTRSSGTAENSAASRISSPVIALSWPRRNGTSSAPRSGWPVSLNTASGYRAVNSRRRTGCFGNECDATATGTAGSYWGLGIGDWGLGIGGIGGWGLGGLVVGDWGITDRFPLTNHSNPQ